MKKPHYITFGQVHRHTVNGKIFDKDCIAVVQAESWKEGRELAFKYFGDQFFTDYHDDDFDMNNLKYFPRGFITL